MAKLIKTIHDRVNRAIRKGQTGYFSPTDIDEEVYTEMLNIWRKHVREFQVSRIVGVILNPFIQPESVTPNSVTGIAALTNAYHYPIAISVVSSGKTVREVDHARWHQMVNHSIEFPTADYPICRFENKTIVAAPASIGQLQILHIRKPVKPVYAYTIVSDRYVYDDVNSVDVEFDQMMHDDIMMRVLENLGVPMREEFTVRVAQQNKLTEGK